MMLVGPMPAESKKPLLPENVAGVLCYALFWVSGVILLLTDKRRYVRYHAAQSIAVFAGLQILHALFERIFEISFAVESAWIGIIIGQILLKSIDAVAILLWLLLMVKAYQGEQYRIPYAGDYAESLARTAKA
jgi:uncharacterized membrane protein